MKELIDKITLVEEIEKRIKETESMKPKFDQFWAGQISAFKGILKILDTFEVKEVDLDKEIELVKGDYEQVDVAWNNDFDYIAKYFFELGLKAKGEVYVVTRSEEHADYVEAVFLSESKAEKYCKPFNENENCYARNITEIKIQ